MTIRVGLLSLGFVMLGACAFRDDTPDESVLLDEAVPLVREAARDVATRELTVDSSGYVVAIVDENLTDVRVKLVARGGAGAKTAPVEVENQLGGVGFEIATLELAGPARVTLSIESQGDAARPGEVHVRALRLRRPKDATAPYATRLAGYLAWSQGTRASFRSADFKASGVAALDRAIARFAAPDGDARLAAQARLIKASALRYFRIDLRESRAAAQAAMQSFRLLPAPDALGEARARYAEARALAILSTQRSTGSTSVESAAGLARESLVSLADATSPLSAVERARALTTLGDLDLNASNLDDADRRYAEARTMCEAGGFLSDVRDIRGAQALALLERGRFRDAAGAFESLLPELDRFVDPERRAAMYLGAARGQSLTGHTDRAIELQLEALELSREYRLRVQEASALLGLGQAYQNRGDLLQGSSFYSEALRIMRDENDTEQLVWGLAAAGKTAREEGNHQRAIEMHAEAVERAMNPIAKVRTLNELGLDHYAVADYPRAIAEFRRSLAVRLQDPQHHAYSDVKRNLAQSQIDEVRDSGHASQAVFAEASRLIDETLASSLRVDDKLGVMGAHRVRGNLFAAQGRATQAIEEFNTTFALAKAYRDASSSAETKGATLTHEQYALRGFLDVSLRAVAARGPAAARTASAAEEAALYTLERARDTYFGPPRSGELDAATSARADSLLQRMADSSVRIAALLRTPDSAARASELATLQASMSDLHAELDALRTANAARATARGDDSHAPAPLRELPRGVVQISYALGDRHAYAWARSAQGIRVAVLSKTPRQLESELIALGAIDRQALPLEMEQALARVSVELLPPGLLPPDTTAVEIVSEGRIAAVPFAGLLVPDSAARGRRMAEAYTLAMISSMYSQEPARRAQPARPFRLVALASGTSGLRSLPVVNPIAGLQAASREVNGVAALFTAADPRANIRLMIAPEGTAEELRRIWATGADVVHFATHALADLRQPLASLLVMPGTDAHGAPTYLTAGQVEGWRGDAELVFLSACDSAIGPPRYAGGMPGLQRAFLRAGARGVVATLWPIEDVLAREFSVDFYRRYTQGMPAAQALGETQRAWLAPQGSSSPTDQARRRVTALAHSFYRQ